MSLSVKKRWEIVFLTKHPYGPKFGASDVARIVKCNRKTVQKWISCYELSGDVSELPRSGRPRKTKHREGNEY